MSHKSARQLTLRGIPDHLFREMQAEARRQRTSINGLLLKRLLPETEKSEGACASLLSLAGTWDAKRAEDFDKNMGEHRGIDREIWS